MANNKKRLNIGVFYLPNREYTDKNTGVKVVRNEVMFRLGVDQKTATLLKNNLRFVKDENGKYPVIFVPEDKVDNFIGGQKQWAALMQLLEKAGYEFTIDDVKSLKDNVDSSINAQKYASSANTFSLTNNYIDDVIDALEKDMNDPTFVNLAKSIGSIGSFVQGDENEVIRKTKLSLNNVFLILSQWKHAGKQGLPTFVATQYQWATFFDRGISQNATPLVVMTPSDVKSKTLAKTLKDNGITYGQMRDNPRLGNAIHKLSRDTDYGQNINSKFFKAIYYDVSDTYDLTNSNKPFDPNSSLDTSFDTASTLASNSATTNDDNKAQDAASSSTKTNADEKLLNSLKEYARKNNNGKLLNELNGGDGLVSGLRYLISRQPGIDREHNITLKGQYIDMVLLLVLTKYGAAPSVRSNLHNSYRFAFRNGAKINRKLFKDVSAWFSNVVAAVDGVNESVSNETLEWVLNQFGLTINDYKRLPYDSNDADMIHDNVTESFKKIFNNIENVKI